MPRARDIDCAGSGYGVIVLDRAKGNSGDTGADITGPIGRTGETGRREGTG